VVGYDAYTRVAVSGKPSFERSKQVRSLGTWQVFSTVASAAHLLGLGAEATARAFGLAALHTPVPFVGKIYEERPMWALKNNYGWVTMGGVLAAQFASAGLEANHSILEGNTGFWAMAGSDRFDRDELTAGLGTEYSVLDVSFKPYSSCRHTHSPLDALRQILESNPVQADQVRAVSVRGGSKIRVFADYRPRTCIDAQFSLPYVVAMMLLGEPTGYPWVNSGRWCDPAVLALADRVQIEADDAAEAQLAKGYMQARVSVELAGGRVLESEATVARGHPQNPLPDTALEAKFLTLAEAAIGPERARELNARLMRLEELTDLKEITDYLRH
jgi:2-methylcitrate dehydratase PrpD